MKGINIFVGILEAVSEVSRILTFAFRLFGNIFAGEVVLANDRRLFDHFLGADSILFVGSVGRCSPGAGLCHALVGLL